MSSPFISICIPTYKRIHLLPRLLDSIERQDYKDFEVIVNNNSEAQQLEEICKEYASRLNIKYYKNPVELSAGANWNRCMELCSGTWIKMMHDDDWFATDDALSEFAKAATGTYGMIWSDHFIKNDTTLAISEVKRSKRAVADMLQDPYLLFGENIIGPPSCMMIHRSVIEQYDINMTWFIDIDLYINVLLRTHAGYRIEKPLVYISHNEQQLTQTHYNNKITVVYEAMLLWQKHGSAMISTIRDYDAWWRMVRNLKIRSLAEFEACTRGLPVPAFIKDIIAYQKNIPVQVLKVSVISKTLMFLCYRFSYLNLK